MEALILVRHKCANFIACFCGRAFSAVSACLSAVCGMRFAATRADAAPAEADSTVIRRPSSSAVTYMGRMMVSLPFAGHTQGSLSASERIYNGAVGISLQPVISASGRRPLRPIKKGFDIIKMTQNLARGNIEERLFGSS